VCITRKVHVRRYRSRQHPRGRRKPKVQTTIHPSPDACSHIESYHIHPMSRPVTLPIRLATQYSKRPALQCLRQRPQNSYTRLDSTPQRQWVPQSKRAFSTTPPRCANGSMSQVRASSKQKAQPSAKLSQKEQEATALRSGKYPEDIGLLPDTFILPRNLADRWKWSIRKKWVYTRVTELMR